MVKSYGLLQWEYSALRPVGIPPGRHCRPAAVGIRARTRY